MENKQYNITKYALAALCVFAPTGQIYSAARANNAANFQQHLTAALGNPDTARALQTALEKPKSRFDKLIDHTVPPLLFLTAYYSYRDAHLADRRIHKYEIAARDHALKVRAAVECGQEAPSIDEKTQRYLDYRAQVVEAKKSGKCLPDFPKEFRPTDLSFRITEGIDKLSRYNLGHMGFQFDATYRNLHGDSLDEQRPHAAILPTVCPAGLGKTFKDLAKHKALGAWLYFLSKTSPVKKLVHG